MAPGIAPSRASPSKASSSFDRQLKLQQHASGPQHAIVPDTHGRTRGFVALSALAPASAQTALLAWALGSDQWPQLALVPLCSLSSALCLGAGALGARELRPSRRKAALLAVAAAGGFSAVALLLLAIGGAGLALTYCLSVPLPSACFALGQGVDECCHACRGHGGYEKRSVAEWKAGCLAGAVAESREMECWYPAYCDGMGAFVALSSLAAALILGGSVLSCALRKATSAELRAIEMAAAYRARGERSGSEDGSDGDEDAGGGRRRGRGPRAAAGPAGRGVDALGPGPEPPRRRKQKGKKKRTGPAQPPDAAGRRGPTQPAELPKARGPVHPPAEPPPPPMLAEEYDQPELPARRVPPAADNLDRKGPLQPPSPTKLGPRQPSGSTDDDASASYSSLPSWDAKASAALPTESDAGLVMALSKSSTTGQAERQAEAKVRNEIATGQRIMQERAEAAEAAREAQAQLRELQAEDMARMAALDRTLSTSPSDVKSSYEQLFERNRARHAADEEAFGYELGGARSRDLAADEVLLPHASFVGPAQPPDAGAAPVAAAVPSVAMAAPVMRRPSLGAPPPKKPSKPRPSLEPAPGGPPPNPAGGRKKRPAL